MSIVSASGEGDMTLAFSLSAIERVATPGTVFADARAWSKHVGIIDDDETRIREFLDRHDLEHDFDQAGTDKWLAMEQIGQAAGTPRAVYVGNNLEDRRVAINLSWEYLTIAEAAEKAGWELRGETSSGGLLEKLRRLLAGR